jgi:asparagine N-glycosylation enzyme membrane subunit Stt3
MEKLSLAEALLLVFVLFFGFLGVYALFTDEDALPYFAMAAALGAGLSTMITHSHVRR